MSTPRPWMTKGACGGHPKADLWYAPLEVEHPYYAHLSNRKAREVARRSDRLHAKEVCNACPVRAQCLGFIMQYEADHPAEDKAGIWGGLTPYERTQLRTAAAKAA